MSQAMDEFSQAVFHIVGSIPTGYTASYGQVAKLAGYPNHSRHVGKLMGRLPRGSKLPWYRVINSQAKISLPAGPAYERQKGLLLAEGVEFIGERVAKAHRW
ncbi:MAG: MGMT family protein, partial [Cellvibrionaceae bacterium]|nr:MGMT family protein [Cellvibrionaceae bacterium]